MPAVGTLIYGMAVGPDGLRREFLRGLNHETLVYNAELGRMVVVYTLMIRSLVQCLGFCVSCWMWCLLCGLVQYISLSLKTVALLGWISTGALLWGL